MFCPSRVHLETNMFCMCVCTLITKDEVKVEWIIVSYDIPVVLDNMMVQGSTVEHN